jgi:hypothetical protein
MIKNTRAHYYRIAIYFTGNDRLAFEYGRIVIEHTKVNSPASHCLVSYDLLILLHFQLWFSNGKIHFQEFLGALGAKEMAPISQTKNEFVSNLIEQQKTHSMESSENTEILSFCTIVSQALSSHIR